MSLFRKPLKPGVTAYEAKRVLAEVKSGQHKWTEHQAEHARDRIMGLIEADSPISEHGRMDASEVAGLMNNLKRDQSKLGLSDSQIEKMGGALNKYVKKSVTPWF